LAQARDEAYFFLQPDPFFADLSAALGATFLSLLSAFAVANLSPPHPYHAAEL
jgi:hypothetical protein